MTTSFERLVRQRAKELNLDITLVSQRAHISRQKLYNLLNDDSLKVRLKIFKSLSRALKIDLDELLLSYCVSYQTTYSFYPKELKERYHFTNLGELIERTCSRKGFNKSELAQKTGLARQTLYRLHQSQHLDNFEIDTLLKLAKGLDLSLTQLVKLNK